MDLWGITMLPKGRGLSGRGGQVGGRAVSFKRPSDLASMLVFLPLSWIVQYIFMILCGFHLLSLHSIDLYGSMPLSVDSYAS